MDSLWKAHDRHTMAQSESQTCPFECSRPGFIIPVMEETGHWGGDRSEMGVARSLPVVKGAGLNEGDVIANSLMICGLRVCRQHDICL